MGNDQKASEISLGYLLNLRRFQIVRLYGPTQESSLLKRPPHGKLKFANSCWRTSKSWQTRAFTRQTRVISQHTLNLQICNMADEVQPGTHEELLLASRFCCMLIAKEETESVEMLLRFGRNCISLEI